ncbi:FAD-binding domain-containing protein [Aspergillus saccharolyticus JOP 1030-1]|uniref:FAD-binding domain-containing protein n=1 Tax=Aspergillus saccharolyticus JOP 1030-1 TaxID=1450539 RepID=A0A318ZLJ1_9EURO|nr:FAD-binding domain-containing protein [Aspergillus saccharolyticus JOP 1030-1]PYH44670.1 FAD-binding domain-containing protein [Aspergillus saccharolyticus JOP 1030-1]
MTEKSIKAQLSSILPDRIEILVSGDPEYGSAIATWNLRAQHKPRAVIRPSTAQDVSIVTRAVQCARVDRVTIRAGGHSFEGLGLGGQDGAVVIDMIKMRRIHSNADAQEVTVEGGALLGEVQTHISQHGNQMLPMGTCPIVGIAGQIQCGGYGFFSRTYGVLVDRVLEMQVVTADGEIRTVSDKQHSDLFYALRGSGGGSFGVITSLTLKTNDIPRAIANFSIKWKIADCNVAAVLKAAHGACLSSPKGLNAMLVAWFGTIELYGTLLEDSKAQCETIWSDVLSSLPAPSSTRMEFFDLLGSVVDVAKNQTSAPWYSSLSDLQREGNEHLRYVKIKSGYIPDPLRDSFLDQLAVIVEVQPTKDVRVHLLTLNPNLIPATDTTSVRCRGCTWFVDMLVFTQVGQYGEAGARAEADKLQRGWLGRIDRLFSTVRTGTYLGDDDFDQGRNRNEMMASFYGPHLPRLMGVKRRYDPGNLFNHPLSVPLPQKTRRQLL